MIYSPDEPAAFLGMEITKQNGRYRLLIPKKAFEDIEQKFADASTPQGLLSRRVHLTEMGRFFKSLECGYLNAYSEAENRDDLTRLVERLSTGAQRTVLEALFSVERLHGMSLETRKFIGIDKLAASNDTT